MFQDRWVMLLLLTGFIASFALLLALTELAEPQDVPVGMIDQSFSGRTVRIRGTASGLQSREAGLFLTITDPTGSIRAIIWKNELTETDVTEGKNVTAVGFIQMYQQRPELIVRAFA